MAKLVLSDLSSIDQTSPATINANSAAIETALESTLSRDGTSPNEMAADLDMDSNRILNLPEPIYNTEPLRVIDAVDLSGLTITPETPASILAKIITVDGAGSGLDADLLDGSSSAAFVKYADHSTLVVTDLDAGASGTAGTVDIFPTTAAKGKIQISATANTGNTTLNITNAAQSAAATHTIPDTNGNAAFIMKATGAVTDNTPVRWDGTTGTLVQGSTVVIGDTGTISSVENLNATGSIITTASSPGNGIGYATGAGGTVTQATSKITSVTLNKACGQITMNNAALASGAETSFTVSNSYVASTDVIIVNHGSAGTVGAYMAQANQIGTGAFNITVTNLSAGSLSEAIVLNFVVIKGVAA